MKKGYIFVAVILFIYLGITLFIVMLNESNKKYLILSPNTVFKYEKVKWVEEKKDIKLKDTKMYLDNIYIGKYKIEKTDKNLQIINKSGNIFEHNNDILGYKGKKIDVIMFEQQNMTNDELEQLNILLNEKGINNYTNSINEKIEFDLNNDGLIDKFYLVSNLYEDENSNKMYSIIYTINNNKLEIIWEQIHDKNSNYDMCIPSIKNVIDIDKKQNFNMIVECTYFSNIGTKHGIISYKGNKYQINQDL